MNGSDVDQLQSFVASCEFTLHKFKSLRVDHVSFNCFYSSLFETKLVFSPGSG